MPLKPQLISVVACSRNDDHGGNPLERTQHFVNGLWYQSLKFKLLIELILVDWNPLPNKKPLIEVLNWPTAHDYFSVRVITVPADYHASLHYGNQIPLFQYLGKNVGIRHAKGDFVLATNIDILFTDELMLELKKGLKENILYRVDRLDSNIILSPNEPFEKTLHHAQDTLVRVNTMYGTISRTGWRIVEKLVKKPSKLKTFLIIILNRITRLTKNFPSNILRFLESRYWKNKSLYYFFSAIFRKFETFDRLIMSKNKNIHTNACGDFTLMSKKDWDKIRGYPEWSIFSWHIDSLLIYQAYYAGYQMQILNGGIYHIEHGGGWTPETAAKLFERLDTKKIKYFTNENFEELTNELKENPGLIYNDENWGCANVNLQEQSPYKDFDSTRSII